MAYSYEGIENSVKDILTNKTNQFKREQAEPALRAIQIAKANLHKAYINQLLSTSVMNQMAQRSQQTEALKNYEIEKELLREEAARFHGKNIRFFKDDLKNQSIIDQVYAKWEKYRYAKRQLEELKSQRQKLFSSSFERESLEKPMIEAVMAIEQARNVFQKPILYKIGFYCPEISPIVQEIEMSFEELVENKLIKIGTNNTDNLLNTLSLKMSVSQSQYASLLTKMQMQKKVTSLNTASSNYILSGQIGNDLYDAKINRGWRYQWYLEGLAGLSGNKQDNTAWSAAPDVISSGKFNYQAKFLAIDNAHASTLQISSLVSIFGSLEAYEGKLKYALGHGTNPSINIQNSIKQYQTSIINSLESLIKQELKI